MKSRFCLLSLAALLISCQAAQSQVSNETSRSVEGGGISAPGWTGSIDPNEASSGKSIKDSKLTADGDKLHITTGPASVFWKTAGSATGNYTVKASFTEPKYMNLNSHPHPYGLFIAGNDLGTPQASYLYCAAYGNGHFIVRGFGPEAFQMNGRRGEDNAAVHKAAAQGDSVSQDIALSVAGDKVSCSINGTVVGTYDKSALVTAGKLKSTDGAFGIRSAHNTDIIVSNFKMDKN